MAAQKSCPAPTIVDNPASRLCATGYRARMRRRTCDWISGNSLARHTTARDTADRRPEPARSADRGCRPVALGGLLPPRGRTRRPPGDGAGPCPGLARVAAPAGPRAGQGRADLPADAEAAGRRRLCRRGAAAPFAGAPSPFGAAEGAASMRFSPAIAAPRCCWRRSRRSNSSWSTGSKRPAATAACGRPGSRRRRGRGGG